MNWRGENEHRRQSSDKSCRPSHTTITPVTARGSRFREGGTQRNAVKGHSRTLAQASFLRHAIAFDTSDTNTVESPDRRGESRDIASGKPPWASATPSLFSSLR
jgi:hypothetical protein